jgi:hypothetical protein
MHPRPNRTEVARAPRNFRRASTWIIAFIPKEVRRAL